ncbi:MAG: Uma2 family endonuclease [Pseudonocardia sp.]|nr:Uma2 family endonuclease [Pseudonocardia sp.]
MTADPVVDHLRFTVEQFERMGEVGVLDPEVRYELLDGEIVVMSPIGPKHAGVVNRSARRFFDRFDGLATVMVQNPIRLLPSSEPQPDLVVARERHDFYESAHPTAEDTLLVVEVADSSLRSDRLVKVPIYARQGVPELWIVDIAARVVHIHTEPTANGYRTVRSARGDEVIAPQSVAGVTFTPNDLLGD